MHKTEENSATGKEITPKMMKNNGQVRSIKEPIDHDANCAKMSNLGKNLDYYARQK